jgi:hypothetical protein
MATGFLTSHLKLHTSAQRPTQFKQRLNTWRLGGFAALRENHLFFICSSLGGLKAVVGLPHGRMVNAIGVASAN